MFCIGARFCITWHRATHEGANGRSAKRLVNITTSPGRTLKKLKVFQRPSIGEVVLTHGQPPSEIVSLQTRL